MVIAVDFDGTCTTHKYPYVGVEIGAALVLKWVVSLGHKLILHTMRSNPANGHEDLRDALRWFEGHGIPLYGVNTNPGQEEWTDSPKVYAELYIDDAALGCPLKMDNSISDRPYVDWDKVKLMLEDIFAGKGMVGHTGIETPEQCRECGNFVDKDCTKGVGVAKRHLPCDMKVPCGS